MSEGEKLFPELRLWPEAASQDDAPESFQVWTPEMQLRVFDEAMKAGTVPTIIVPIVTTSGVPVGYATVPVRPVGTHGTNASAEAGEP